MCVDGENSYCLISLRFLAAVRRKPHPASSARSLAVPPVPLPTPLLLFSLPMPKPLSSSKPEDNLGSIMPELMRHIELTYMAWGSFPIVNWIFAVLEYEMPTLFFLGVMPLWEFALWFLIMGFAWDWGVREVVMSSPRIWIGLIVARSGVGWLNSFVPGTKKEEPARR